MIMDERNGRYDLAGRVAVVTGSAQGIGQAIARELDRCGAKVVVSDVKVEQGGETARELGGDAMFVPCDVSDKRQVRTLVDATLERYGRLDLMVNNAGINSGPEQRVTVDTYPDDLWERIIAVDLNGTFWCCTAAASVMRRQKSGVIINIASIAGVVALRLQIAFVAAKAAILRMTEAMACELGPYGIRVNAVSPGSTLTEGTRTLFYGTEEAPNPIAERILSFIPLGRPGWTDEMAHATAFLASDQAAYITGHNLVVDGGWTCGFNRDF
jgi:NAD(P)-dependent dehydrogenase (short-subunit alcohol dehydrogenase family)